MTQHDDLQVLELAGGKPKTDQPQYALKRDVTDRQEHEPRHKTKSAGYFIQIEFAYPTV